MNRPKKSISKDEQISEIKKIDIQKLKTLKKNLKATTKDNASHKILQKTNKNKKKKSPYTFLFKVAVLLAFICSQIWFYFDYKQNTKNDILKKELVRNEIESGFMIRKKDFFADNNYIEKYNRNYNNKQQIPVVTQKNKKSGVLE